MTARYYRQMHSGALPDRIMDLLETEGGWRTTSWVQGALDASVNSTHQALFRLRRRGLIESRPRPSDIEGCWTENEWRAA